MEFMHNVTVEVQGRNTALSVFDTVDESLEWATRYTTVLDSELKSMKRLLEEGKSLTHRYGSVIVKFDPVQKKR